MIEALQELVDFLWTEERMRRVVLNTFEDGNGMVKNEKGLH